MKEVRISILSRRLSPCVLLTPAVRKSYSLQVSSEKDSDSRSEVGRINVPLRDLLASQLPEMNDGLLAHRDIIVPVIFIVN